MKETIKYFYNIYPDKLYEVNNGVYFYLNDFKYYFIKVEREIQDINFLVKISNELYKQNILVDTFVRSKDGLFYVKNLEDTYVMLRVNSPEDEIMTIDEIIRFNNSLISNNTRNISSDWASLWEKKIDQAETQVSEFNTDYPLIQSSFDYFVGLSENAISYFRDTLNEEDINSLKININHNRVNSIIYSGLMNNPLTFTFDYEVRDLAEYLKSCFLNKSLDYDEIMKIINKYNFSKCSLRLLYSRLLYPSYYYDLLEKIMVFDYDESILLDVINSTDDYEYFLREIYDIINSKVNIPPVLWLFENDK